MPATNGSFVAGVSTYILFCSSHMKSSPTVLGAIGRLGHPAIETSGNESESLPPRQRSVDQRGDLGTRPSGPEAASPTAVFRLGDCASAPSTEQPSPSAGLPRQGQQGRRVKLVAKAPYQVRARSHVTHLNGALTHLPWAQHHHSER
jgi:hypothetical protein